MSKVTFYVFSCFLMLSSQSLFAADVDIFGEIHKRNLLYFFEGGRQVAELFRHPLVITHSGDQTAPSFRRTWEQYDYAVKNDFANVPIELRPRNFSDYELRDGLQRLVEIASENRNAVANSVMNNQPVETTALGLIHFAKREEYRTSTPVTEFRKRLVDAARYPIGVSCMQGTTFGTIAFQIVYASFVNYPVDILEQIRCNILTEDGPSADYRSQYSASFLKYALPRSSHSILFIELNEMIRFRLLQEAITNFRSDFGESKESLIQLQLASAKAQQSFELYRIATNNALSNRLTGGQESEMSKLRIRTALLFGSSNFDFYALCSIPTVGLICAVVSAGRERSRRRDLRSQSRWLLPLMSLWLGVALFFRELQLAIQGRSERVLIQIALLLFGFAFGIWVSQAGTFAGLI